MTAKTRYVVVGSLLTLGVGLGIGLAAYATGFTTSALGRQGGPDELQFVPSNAALVAYADVHDIMLSDLRQRVRSAVQMKEDGQREFQEKTGINIETDIDHVVVAVVPPSNTQPPDSAIVLARGRFDQVKIEALMREHGAQVEEYRGARLVVAPADAKEGKHNVSVAFLEPGLVALGSHALIRGAVDLKAGGASLATNDEMMSLIRDLDSGNAWAVGKFDALTSHARLPEGLVSRIPAINLFSASAQIDSGVRTRLQIEARDDAAANSLRDVVRGFVALAKLQASGRPEVSGLVDSIQLGGSGKSVSLAFDVPSSTLDVLEQLKDLRPTPRP